MNKLISKLLLLVMFLSSASCTTAESVLQTYTPEPTSTVETLGTTATPTSLDENESPEPEPIQHIGYTHYRSDGNRVIEGGGSLPSGTSIEMPLDGTPVWVVAVPYEDSSLWAVILEDGRVQGFKINTQRVESASITPDQLNPESPPLLFIEGGIPKLLTVPSPDQSLITHPIILPSQGLRAFIQNDGSLILMDESDQVTASLSIDALPDARITYDDAERLLVLSGPTSKYDHGVLGDSIEATSITLVETVPEIRILKVIQMPAGQVIEGIAPIWADLNDDGTREIIVTLSDGINGAQLVVYSEDGSLFASGDAIGLGYRWRHQIAAAHFGPNGKMEIVDILTPHIGGVVEFFQVDGDQLAKVAQIGGYTSHVIGSRNLDMAAAGDFDGDGNIELLLPNQARDELGAIQRTAEGAELVWSLPIKGQINTNLGAVTLENGTILIGIGRADNVFKIWLP